MRFQTMIHATNSPKAYRRACVLPCCHTRPGPTRAASCAVKLGSASAWRSLPVGAERVLATSLVPAYLPMGAEYLLSARSERSSSYL